MRQVGILFIALLWGLASGCAMKLPMVGSYYKEALTGQADYNPFSGTSQIQIGDRARKVRCEGNTHGSYAPLLTLSGAGYGGEGEIRCSDGRLFKVRWETLSWATGYGVGRDQNGDRMTFVFGMEQEQAEDFLKKELPVILKRSR
ncbi:MAG: hypothetical protein HYV05_07865 [Deltaproteobacteria bacterium]|nr:hypothetical protein [Deltaproteobacteria bacterium]MBI2348554.1 hypothetical protein [Deltaproteobacteria bacterium]MBI2538498.1 hypothetical protein [Deltaproteobacteria bacterium]MBI3061039.1 hypothetical protein [Deltaproteobacteria bacterium]